MLASHRVVLHQSLGECESHCPRVCSARCLVLSKPVERRCRVVLNASLRPVSRMCGSADLFAPHKAAGYPGGLAAGRGASAGFNSASVLDGATLAATVAKILPPHAPFGQDYVLKKSLLFASIISQVLQPPTTTWLPENDYHVFAHSSPLCCFALLS